MVLPGKLGGRVGRRRNFFQNPESIQIPGFFMHWNGVYPDWVKLIDFDIINAMG